MPGESERRSAGGPGRKGPASRHRGRGGDFADHPVYRSALRFCGFVLDLESKFPDDEHPLLYVSLKRCGIEIGSLLASGFGRSGAEARLELWETARSRAMEARHLVMVARMRYVVDERDVERFEEHYFDLLEGIETLIGAAAGEGVSAQTRTGSRRRT